MESADKLDLDAWIGSMRYVAQHYRLPMSVQAAHLAATWSTQDNGRETIRDLARKVGLRIKFAGPSEALPSSWRLPLIVQLYNGQVGVVTSLSATGEAGVVFSGDLETPLPAADLFRYVETIAIARPARAIPDARVDTYIRPYEETGSGRSSFGI